MDFKEEYQKFEKTYDTEIKDMVILTSKFICLAS